MGYLPVNIPLIISNNVVPVEDTMVSFIPVILDKEEEDFYEIMAAFHYT